MLGGEARMDNGNSALMRILPLAMLPDYSGKRKGTFEHCTPYTRPFYF